MKGFTNWFYVPEEFSDLTNSSLRRRLVLSLMSWQSSTMSNLWLGLKERYNYRDCSTSNDFELSIYIYSIVFLGY